MKWIRCTAKIDAGVPNYRMQDRIKPVKPGVDERGNFINENIWPREEKLARDGKTVIKRTKLLHGGFIIVKGEEYEVFADEITPGKGLGTIFEVSKATKDK